ncbi:MAG: hypothetical protein ACE5EE_11425 [Fidelibacterota bacterium]
MATLNEGQGKVTVAASRKEQLNRTFRRDQKVWDKCASSYEKHVVNGHPDIRAYEEFEEELLDDILQHLIKIRGSQLSLYDIGCGSARIHLRYGLKTTRLSDLSPPPDRSVSNRQLCKKKYRFNRRLSDSLVSVSGIDFSSQMIELATSKLVGAGLKSRLGDWLVLECGSAFDLPPLPSGPMPIVVNVCNSIGVMQGPEGAIKLFKTMRRMVEPTGGIAIISAYRKEAVKEYAINNYESTMNVSGQPRWLKPDTYARPDYKLSPQMYKTAGNTDQSIIVDVFGQDGKLVREGLKLTRDVLEVERTIETGHIRTYTDYESYWYSFDQIGSWIREYWPKGKTYHIEGKRLDRKRAVPVQLAILDTNNLLRGFFKE